MSKIIDFPGIRWQTKQMELQQPEPQQENEEDINYEEIYAEPENFITHGQCYRCGRGLKYDDYNEEIWSIHQYAEYGSILDGSRIDIEICDTCFVEFLSQKKS